MKAQKNIKSIRLVVKPDFKKRVQRQADGLGVNVSTYIKHLILSDLQEIPVKYASERVKKNVEKSLVDSGIETGSKRASEVLGELRN